LIYSEGLFIGWAVIAAYEWLWCWRVCDFLLSSCLPGRISISQVKFTKWHLC